MANVTLKKLLSPRRGKTGVADALLHALNGSARIEDVEGNVISGQSVPVSLGGADTRSPIVAGTETLGWVTAATPEDSHAIAGILAHLASLESEKKSMADEVLSLYREINLIHRFAEGLSTLIDPPSIASSALEQARQVLASTGSALILLGGDSEIPQVAAADGTEFIAPDRIARGEGLLGRLLKEGSAEIVNDVKSDSRFAPGDPQISSLIFAPLRVKDQLRGAIILVSSSAVIYSAADLKLLSTLSVQTATAIESARLHGLHLHAAKAAALQETLREVESQKQKAEEMLLNILPESVARELQQDGAVQPMYFEDVTIGFTDFVGFSRSTMSMPAEEVVTELNHYFTEFDRIIARYGLEKLKTIGDSYMFASGLPVRRPANPIDAVLAAIEMLEVVERSAATRSGAGWKIRIGLHTGPVIAGVVGIRKFAFDVWGETVNFASRMESAGEPNRINISERTFVRVKDFLATESRGRMKTKDGQDVEMYFVNGVLEALMTDQSASPPPLFGRRYRLYFRDSPASFPQHLIQKKSVSG